MPPGGFRPAGAVAAARPPAAAATPALPTPQQQARASTSSTSTGGPRTGSGATAGAGSAREKARGGAEKGEMPRSVAGRVAQVGGGETSGGALSKASPRVTILAGCGIPAPFTPFTPTSSTASVARPRSPLVALPLPSNVQTPVASSSSAQTSTSRSAILPAAPAPSPPMVTSSHFSAAKARPSASTSTPRPPPSVQVIPVKRPSPADKGKGKAPVEQDDDEEIDENLNPHLKARASPKRARISLDSGYTEGDPVKVEDGENKENDPGDLPRGGAEVEPEIPESENGEEGELLEVVARSSATGGDVGMAGPGVEETRSGIGDDGMGDHVDADLAQIEEDLLAFTNRRVAIMQGFVDIAERGGGRSKDGQDANELRHTQSYVEERYQEARGRLEALGIPFTELQIQTEKRASCLEELAEVVWSPGSYSSNGNDEGLLRHTLSYIDTRIAQLKASPSSTHSRPASRPPLPRIASILPGSTSHHASPSAVPGSVVRPSVMPVLLPFGGPGAGEARPAAQKASSTTSGTGSQTSATVAALAAQQQRMSGRVGTGMGGGTPAAARNGPAKVNATNSSESEQITLSSSSDHDPIHPPIKRPAPLPPAKRPAAAAAPTSTSGFRAAGTGAQQPAARTVPPTVHTSVSSDKGKGRVEHPLPEVDALLDGVDFDGMDFEEFDGSPRPQQQQQQHQHQRHPNQPASTTRRNNNESANNAAFTITLDDPPPPRNYQANPAHQSLPEQRRLPPGVQSSAHRNISIASTVSTASDLVITSGADAASTSKTAASTSTSASKAVVSAPKKTYPWTRDVYKALRQRFGLKSFRVNQEDAINATLSGRDVFVLLPTGGGKSLCFQLPAVVSSGKTRGVTIVVSPLLSLISDQTKGLMEKDIPVVFLNSTMPAADKQFALSCLRAEPPMACLAYVTPEQIVKSGQFRDLLSDLHRRNQLARFVLDEAHCISSWGHDFRPDYKQMGTLKRDYPDVPLIALTATANDRVKTDVMTNLAMDRPLVLTQSFNRANLRYHVRKKGKTILADIAEFIKKDHQGECGIIYCSSKKQCEDVADKLRREYSIKSMHYHAGMDKDDRIRVQENWQAGRVHVICATIAFGMGIDKPDVRFVIHHSLSQSLEAYYQETGRAGRDGMSSVCVLYFAYGDTKLLMRLIDEGEGTPEQKEHNRANLRRVVQYCMNETDCRRTQVLQYFGEQFPRDMCHKTCDNCMAPKNVEMRDVTDLAQNAMRLVKAIQKDKGVTMLYAIDVFRGLKYQKISAAGHDRLAEAGKGSGIDRGDAERLFQLLASEQILGERYERNGLGFTNAYVTLGPRAHQFLNGRITLQMGFAGKEKTGKGKGKGAVAAKTVNESYEHDDYEGEYVDELYDEQTGIYDEDPDGEWDPWGRRVVRTNSMNALQDADDSGVQASKQASSSKKAGNGGDTSTLLAQLMDLRERTAADQGRDASAVISDKALQLIATRRPQSVSDFLTIAGLTPKDCDWWTDHGGKALCIKFGAVSATSGSSKGSTSAAAASKSRSTKSTASNARTPVAAAAAAASAAEARSAAAARRPPASRAKAPAKTVGKQFDLAAFKYKPGGSGASGSAGGGGGGGGGIMAMPVMRKK